MRTWREGGSFDKVLVCRNQALNVMLRSALRKTKITAKVEVSKSPFKKQIFLLYTCLIDQSLLNC